MAMTNDAAGLSLQQEALARVRQMQRRAMAAVNRPAEEPWAAAPNPPPAAQNQPPPNPEAPHPPGRQRPPGADGLLGQLFGANRPGRSNRPHLPNPPTGGAPPAPGGLIDLIRTGLGGDTGGLADSLRSAVAQASRPLSELLDAFAIDGEKLLILLVMWVIFNERSENKTLLLALGYLLL